MKFCEGGQGRQITIYLEEYMCFRGEVERLESSPRTKLETTIQPDGGSEKQAEDKQNRTTCTQHTCVHGNDDMPNVYGNVVNGIFG